MRYLSIDIEATGLAQDDLIIEFAAIPFDSKAKVVEEGLSFHSYVRCPSFSELRPRLDPWVIEHNKELIDKAHNQGLEISSFKDKLTTYLSSSEIQRYFGKEKIVVFGKSLNAIDLPFLNRDLGWQYMRQYFSHRQLDLSCVVYGLIDMGILPPQCESGSELMAHLGMGTVCHTALEDARNTVLMYLKILKMHSKT